MLAYHFPPENAIGAQRPFRFYKYAPGFGFAPVVVTAAEQSGPNPLPRVHHVADPFKTRIRSADWHVERFIRRFILPGAHGIQWANYAARVCEREIDAARESGDRVILYSTFPPLGTHIAALRVATKCSVPWVADFRDPFVTDAVRYLNSLGLRVANYLERRMMQTAALVIVNTEEAREEWTSRYPHAADKIKTIYNGFDPEANLFAPPLPPCERKVITHIGALYTGRHAGPILSSLDRLFRNSTLPPLSVSVRFIGHCEPASLIPPEVIQSGTKDGWLDFTQTHIPQAEATARAQQSHALLLVQPQSATQVPGKLFEYIRIGRPILAFIPPDSAIERILRQCGIPNTCVYTGDAPEVVDEKLLRFLEFSSGPWKPDARFERSFNAVSQTETLCSLMQEVIAPERIPQSA